MPDLKEERKNRNYECVVVIYPKQRPESRIELVLRTDSVRYVLTYGERTEYLDGERTEYLDRDEISRIRDAFNTILDFDNKT